MGTLRSAQVKRTWIWNTVNSQGVVGLGYEEEKLISAFCVTYSSTHKTAVEIIKDFELTDKIIRKDGMVYSRRFFNPDLSIREEMFEDEQDPEDLIKNLTENTESQKGVEKSGN